MADRHLHTANAFSTTLSAQMGPTDLTASVNSTSGAPSTADDGMILCIDPEDANKREYILFEGSTSSSFTTTTINNRYLDGSAAGSGVTHDSGATVRAVPTEQFIEDLHDRIDADMDTSTGHDHDGSDSKTLGAGSIGTSQLAADAVTEAEVADEAIRDEHFDNTDTPLSRVFTVADATARDALTNLRAGDQAYLQDEDLWYTFDGTAWWKTNGNTGSTTLTDDTPAQASTWEQWGTQDVTFTDPPTSRAVTVMAWLNGNISGVGLSSVKDADIRVRVSFDGGSTWDNGAAGHAEQTATEPNESSIASFHRASGTPSGNVVVEAQLNSTGTNMEFNGGQLMAEWRPS